MDKQHALFNNLGRPAFDRETERRAAEVRHNHTDTSTKAAHEAAPNASSVQAIIMEHMNKDPSRPRSMKQVAQETGLNYDGVKATVNRLHERGLLAKLVRRGVVDGKTVQQYVVASYVHGRPTEPYVKGKRARDQQHKIERLRQQLRDHGHVPCC